MLTNNYDTPELVAKKMDWLDVHSYSEKDVIQDSDGLDFVWDIDERGNKRRIYLDTLDL